MEQLSREPSHTPFEQQYKLQLELLDRTAVIVQDLDMTDNDLILLIGALKHYLHENQPVTFQVSIKITFTITFFIFSSVI